MYKGRTDNYPDDIRQYDHDPRSPFYEEPYSDEQYEEYAEKTLQERLEDSYYGDDWIEDINYKDKGHEHFLSLIADIRAGMPVSQEDINKVFTYFINIANDTHKRYIDNEDLGEDLLSDMEEQNASMRYGI